LTIQTPTPTTSEQVRAAKSPDRGPLVEPLLLTTEEAANVLRISRSKAYELIASGRLPSITLGRSRRVPLDALRKWIADQIG
jgi:excisionase family DNA binding protein